MKTKKKYNDKFHFFLPKFHFNIVHVITFSFLLLFRICSKFQIFNYYFLFFFIQ